MVTDNLKKKLGKAQALTRSLDKSLALEHLWPEVFDNGRARSYWMGKEPTHSRLAQGDPLHLYHEFIVTDGAGEKRMFSYEEVPEILGGGLEINRYKRITNLTESS